MEWTITRNPTPYAPGGRVKDEIRAIPSILKISKSPSISNESFNVKFPEEESEPSEDVIVQKSLSDKIRNLTQSLNKLKQNEASSGDPEYIERLLKKREEELRLEFNQQLETEIEELKLKFDAILQNEQVRTSYMLHGAHRDRKEKIKALKTQLECKNLAGLMYVMCLERKKCKVKTLKIVEEYTNYIKELHEILADSQKVILDLSRGYKTAARVDREWKEKVIAVIKEFRAFVYNFAGGCPEANQYFFDIPRLLKIKNSTRDNPHEDPCECPEIEEKSGESTPEYKDWWECMDDDKITPPFVVYGDMEHLTIKQKRTLNKLTKAPKTAPAKWKEYRFNKMPIMSDCCNLDLIKDKYMDRIPLDKWECHVGSQPSLPSVFASTYANATRRNTTPSVDYRNMGSILKIITTNNQQPLDKAMLLGARDSMEIASTTRLKRKSAMESDGSEIIGPKTESHRRRSRTSDHAPQQMNCPCMTEPVEEMQIVSPKSPSDDELNLDSLESSKLGSAHHDSKEKIMKKQPEKDRIQYEKECPMPECQLQVDSFIRALPKYMKASPFTHFEMDFDDYEVCSPEQLQVLRARIESRSRLRAPSLPSPLAEWPPAAAAVSTQTSAVLLQEECCCAARKMEERECEVYDGIWWAPAAAGVSTQTSAALLQEECCCAARKREERECEVYDVKNLLPLKKALNEIKQAAFYDPTIQFDRFEVVGEPSERNLVTKTRDFKADRIDELTRILRKHPSLNDLFQANHRC